MYDINDIVVYRRSVCRVVGRHEDASSGEQCYLLVPYANKDNSVIMQVPVANRGGHLRNLMTREQVEQLIAETPEINVLESKPANMKSLYATLLKGDDIADLVRIIKTSYARNQKRYENHKRAAAVDSEYLERAEKYLFTELSVVLGMGYDESRDYFNSEVEKASQKN